MKAIVLEKRSKDGIRIGDFPDPAKASDHMESARQFGKIVLTIP